RGGGGGEKKKFFFFPPNRPLTDRGKIQVSGLPPPVAIKSFIWQI
ncbi:hypothetical protein HMPREF9541_03362, partial [Escherichia coli MS 116-1]